MMHNAQKEIVEKIVEREVIKEVRVGVSEEEMAAIHRKNEEEKRRVMKQVGLVQYVQCPWLLHVVFLAVSTNHVLRSRTQVRQLD
jgi:hypothetical protein